MPNAEGPLAGKRGLVLEDEFLIALDLEELLQGAGAEILAVSRIEKALEALHDKGPWDFAILDRHLGNTTSAGVAAAFAEKNIPFLYLTGSRSASRPAAPAPDAPVIEKPYQPDKLVSAVVQLFGAR
ncbi:MAG: response regulator [Proteobacteria bacterium]|nr:response regulator [Pseudomonadota bacterium]